MERLKLVRQIVFKSEINWKKAKKNLIRQSKSFNSYLKVYSYNLNFKMSELWNALL